MRKIVWSCWFQGLDSAPELVRNCLASWRARNPDWEVRCLDAGTIARYIDLSDHVDLTRQQITAASLSDILRLLLLHEYGGVWADATTFCHAPLDEWLPQAAGRGFFAFARPGEDRELASWFIAASVGNTLLSRWASQAIGYWRERTSTSDYFWVHHQFGELLAIDDEARKAWRSVPRISADGPHSVQAAGMYEDYEEVRDRVDWSSPVFKLTHRYEESRAGPNSLIGWVAGLTGRTPVAAATGEPGSSSALPIAQLRVGTENLGDHIQIIAAERLLARAGLHATSHVDRDDEIADAPAGGAHGETGILLNGWFKTNAAQWPPHRAYSPIYLSFHIRLFQATSLLNQEAIVHYRRHGPVGCRDRHTLSLLRSHDVEAFLSHCLSLTSPRRLLDAREQTEVFVVSRDRRILEHLPEAIGPYTFVSHYSGTHDFDSNMVAARATMEMYRSKARLIVTSLLHCALPAIAMGIPVVVLWPPNDGAAHRSDQERFSSLTDIVPVFDISEINQIDWSGYLADVSSIKLHLIDTFFLMVSRWGSFTSPAIGGIASPTDGPRPENFDAGSYLNDQHRLDRLAAAHAADRQKWGAASSYKPAWAARGAQAAAFVADGETVLEIGTGTGTFRALVENRCDYTGADLQPLDNRTVSLNMENDPLPKGTWDVIVLLGVLEYIHDVRGALTKVFAAASKIVLTYCCPVRSDASSARRARGWVSSLSREELLTSAIADGFELAHAEAVDSADDFDQTLFVFRRQAVACNLEGRGSKLYL